MAKIQITESELKQIIRESVEGVLQERVNYGMEWNNLSPEEQQAAAQKYSGGLHGVIQGYKYPDGTTGTTPAQYATQAQGTPIYDMNKVQKIYNRKRTRKEKNGNLTYSSDQYNNVQGQLNAKNAEISKLNGTVSGYKAAIDTLSKAIMGQVAEAAAPAIDSSLPGNTAKAPANPGQAAAISAKSVVPNLDQLLSTINKLRASASRVPGLQNQLKQLTTQNQTLAQQNQSLTQRVQNNQNKVNPIASTALASKATAATPTQTPLAGQKPGTVQA